MEKSPTLFLSYCWSNSDVADTIEKDLLGLGLTIIRDKRDLQYKDSIKEFMKRVRKEDFALVLISNEYLKSKNCMYEINELFKDEDFNKKLLPVVLESTKIYHPLDRIPFIEFWESQKKVLEDSLKTVSAINSLNIYKELNEITNISNNIDNFLNHVTTINHISFDKTKNHNYKELLEFIKFDGKILILKVFAIKQIKDLELKELALELFLKDYPQHKLGNFEKALTSYDKREFKKAKKYYEIYLEEIDGTNIDALNNYASLLEQNFGETELAKLNYEKALAINSDYYPALNNLGLILYEKEKNVEKAKELFEKVITLNPDADWAFVNLGRIYQQEYQNIDRAEELFKQAVQINKNNYQAYFNLGLLYKDERKDYKKTIEYFSEASKIDGVTPGVFFNLAVAYVEHFHEFEIAKHFYKKYLTMVPNDCIALNNLGYVHQRLGNYDEAFDLYKEALEVNNDFANAHGNLANIYNENFKNFVDAEIHYKEAIRIEPENLIYKINLGILYSEFKKFKESQEILKNVINQEPNNIVARREMVFLFCKMEDDMLFRKEFTFLLDLVSTDYVFLVNLGNYFSTLFGKFSEAKECYLRAINLERKSVEGYINYALLNYQLSQTKEKNENDFELAKTFYIKAKEIDSDLIDERLEKYFSLN
ncbi:MAG: tetratricopeptide repeat protein [Ignavibacteria bacterium]|nr:tetratricopeptide repeat protein [Ignavibacteria bacterium]